METPHCCGAQSAAGLFSFQQNNLRNTAPPPPPPPFFLFFLSLSLPFNHSLSAYIAPRPPSVCESARYRWRETAWHGLQGDSLAWIAGRQPCMVQGDSLAWCRETAWCREGDSLVQGDSLAWCMETAWDGAG